METASESEIPPVPAQASEAPPEAPKAPEQPKAAKPKAAKPKAAPKPRPEGLEGAPRGTPAPEPHPFMEGDPESPVSVFNRHVATVAGVPPLSAGTITRAEFRRYAWAFRP